MIEPAGHAGRLGRLEPLLDESPGVLALEQRRALGREPRGGLDPAHSLSRRDGAITQFVPVGKRAWHAGKSRYHGRRACNDFSIGIELEGADTTPYTEAQYESLTGLVAALALTLWLRAPETLPPRA